MYLLHTPSCILLEVSFFDRIWSRFRESSSHIRSTIHAECSESSQLLFGVVILPDPTILKYVGEDFPIAVSRSQALPAARRSSNRSSPVNDVRDIATNAHTCGIQVHTVYGIVHLFNGVLYEYPHNSGDP